jgi:uncharacterized protein (TIGR01777 family)
MAHAESRGLHLLVTGAGGLIGSALVARLSADGHRVRRLVRRPAGPAEITWNPASGILDPAALEGADGVIHLAGENIGARWTRTRRARIRESRGRGTRLLSETLARLARPPSFLISASAIGIYGDRGDEILTESSAPGDPARDFLVSVCLEWEASADAARAVGIRVVHPRFGMVLTPDGGALRKLLLPFRLGLGGPMGTGAHWMSWVALHDAVEALAHLLSTESLAGPINVSAPEPVTNREFTQTLGRVLGRPALIPVPAVALRTVFGEMADRTILSSARVLPARLTESGFRFTHPHLEAALRSMLTRREGSSFPV